MFDKLEFILEKYEELSMKVSDPDVINNQPLWQKYIKEIGEMEPIVNKYKEYRDAKSNVAEAKEMLESGDDELRELAKMEIAELEDKIPEMEDELKILLLPKDPNDDKNVIVEIRAGAGGEEAALFAAEIYRMYVHYAERRGWKVETLEADETGIGGMKSVNFMVTGAGAYSGHRAERGHPAYPAHAKRGDGAVFVCAGAGDELFHLLRLCQGVSADAAYHAHCRFVRAVASGEYSGLRLWRRLFQRVLFHKPRAAHQLGAGGRRLRRLGKVER